MSREKCEMCETEYRKDDWESGGGHDFRVVGNTLYYFDDNFGWEGVEINFCPMCGRPLAETAKQ